MTKQQGTKTIIARLEEQAHGMLLPTSVLQNYIPCTPLTTQLGSNSFTPNIISVDENRETTIYKIQLSNNINYKKRHFFASYTGQRNSEFQIITPEPNLSAAEKVIIENDIRNLIRMYVPN